MGPHSQEAPPGPGVDHAVDQVTRMAAIVEQARAFVPDLRWKPPPLKQKWHLLIWTDASGETQREAEDDLRKLADWAEEKWLAGRGPHTALIVEDSAYTVEGPNTGRPANLGWPGHYPMEAVCAVCGLVVRREKIDPGQLDWTHTGRAAGDPPG
jgi:hypothetical protein